MREVRRKGLAMLPEVLGRPLRHQPMRPMSARYWVILLAVLLPPATIITSLEALGLAQARIHEPLAHMLLEGFCALIALVVFYVLRQEWAHYGGRRLALLTHGFLLYGVINLSHALSPHGSHSFVLLHSMAGNVLAIVALASVAEERDEPGRRAAPRESGRHAITLHFLLAGIAIVIVGVLIAEYVPWRRVDGSFTLVATGVNIFSAVLFAFTGLVLLADFRRSGEPILFCFGLCMLAFAVTHGLFPFSKLWDLAWWGWHVVKLAIFLGLLFGIAYEAVQTLQDQIDAVGALQHSLSVLGERNAELSAAYEQLASTQASLVKAERLATLGLMAGSVAHEIRNPLGTVANCLGLLRRPEISRDESMRALTIADEHVDRLEQIVVGTLDAVRGQVVRREAIALDAVVEEVVATSRLEASGIKVEMAIACDLTTVIGWPQQLRQLVWNLVTNAVEAMAGEGTLLIKLEAAGSDLVLTVQDDGPGIPDALRDRIFEPLFSTKTGGTGLGLAVVRQIAADHGGTVEVRKPVERGAEIAVRLPRGNPPPALDAAAE
jgi:signal transduction histidine kinase